MDKDGSGDVDHEKALAMFTRFGKVAAKDLRSQMDKNHVGVPRTRPGRRTLESLSGGTHVHVCVYVVYIDVYIYIYIYTHIMYLWMLYYVTITYIYIYIYTHIGGFPPGQGGAQA